MRDTTMMLGTGLLAICLAATPLAARVQDSQTPDMAIARDKAGAATREAPRSADGDFVVGRSVRLRSTGTPIGTIVAGEESHAFPRSFPHARAKAVLIRRKDGVLDWVPVEGLSKIYLSVK